MSLFGEVVLRIRLASFARPGRAPGRANQIIHAPRGAPRARKISSPNVEFALGVWFVNSCLWCACEFVWWFCFASSSGGFALRIRLESLPCEFVCRVCFMSLFVEFAL